MRGRVMALWAIVFLGSTPIGAPITGVVAAHFGARAALGMGAVATLVTAVWAATALRRIRAEERRDAAATGEPAGLRPRAAGVPVRRR
jgi:predicted MFS family arabinose efflux permease